MNSRSKHSNISPNQRMSHIAVLQSLCTTTYSRQLLSSVDSAQFISVEIQDYHVNVSSDFDFDGILNCNPAGSLVYDVAGYLIVLLSVVRQFRAIWVQVEQKVDGNSCLPDEPQVKQNRSWAVA
ncbi:hypothetical protein CSKR_112769 [Clonorchis sinensis]|uniref:Uncharacterized protein n=1 Tax=Clonorchis sinensis TaxID=79923 RepID=A0A419PSX6_CLOSI|nr:hypothetical protein CSKR_112769 [Clonorchis sinensis]